MNFSIKTDTEDKNSNNFDKELFEKLFIKCKGYKSKYNSIYTIKYVDTFNDDILTKINDSSAYFTYGTYLGTPYCRFLPNFGVEFTNNFYGMMNFDEHNFLLIVCYIVDEQFWYLFFSINSFKGNKIAIFCPLPDFYIESQITTYLDNSIKLVSTYGEDKDKFKLHIYNKI
jgi:hypothetical protein